MRHLTQSTKAVRVPSVDKATWPFPASGRLAYIDGLRAIAIIAVVAFHAHLPGFRGGFVGVDVFFVISGFLITQQIVSQILVGRFSATEFYARRILRILPPLLLVTAVTVTAAPLFPLLTQELRDLAASAAATAAMISNYYFTSDTEYFAPRSELNPLLHTWSLGVEEQYYLFAPAYMGAVVAIARRRKWQPIGALLWFGAVGIIVSYVILVVLVNNDHRLAFFSIMSRSWQFGVGGMLAIGVLNGMSVPARLRSALGMIGLLTIAVAVVSYNEHMDYPGLAAGCVPTLGAFLLIASGLGNERAPLLRVLASRPAVTIGVLSYSWYLWHWPLIELARTLPIGDGSIWKDVVSSTAALLLSIPTYLFLERPLKALRRSETTRRFADRIVGVGVASSALIALFALVPAYTAVFDRKLEAIKIGQPSENLTGCRTRGDLPTSDKGTPCIVGGNSDPSVLFWGDSHMMMLTPIAEWSARAERQSAVVLHSLACPPLLGIEIDYFVKSKCAEFNAGTLAWFEKQQAHPIAGVVLAARWSYYNGQDTPTGDADVPQMLWRDVHRPGRGYSDMLYHGLSDLLRALSSRVRVLIVGPVPELEKNAVNCLARLQLDGQSPEFCSVVRAKVELRHHDAVAVLQRVASAFPNSRLIDPVDVFCERDRCWPFGPGGVFYGDTDHLNPFGAEMLYQHFQGDFLWVYPSIADSAR